MLCETVVVGRFRARAPRHVDKCAACVVNYINSHSQRCETRHRASRVRRRVADSFAEFFALLQQHRLHLLRLHDPGVSAKQYVHRPPTTDETADWQVSALCTRTAWYVRTRIRTWCEQQGWERRASYTRISKHVCVCEHTNTHACMWTAHMSTDLMIYGSRNKQTQLNNTMLYVRTLTEWTCRRGVQTKRPYPTGLPP